MVPLTPKMLAQYLREQIPNLDPIMIEGPPGCGKTSIVRQVAAELGYDCPYFPPAITLDPVDLRGVPHVEQNGHGKITNWAVPAFLHFDPDWKGIMFIDEAPQGTTAIQASFGQMLYGGRLGDWVKPKKSMFILAGNRQADRAGAHRMISLLEGRLKWVELVNSNEDWQEWARAFGICSEIRTYLNSVGGKHLNTFDPKSADHTCATQRTWELADRAFKAASESMKHPAMASAVGGAVATAFMEYWQLYAHMPDLDAIIRNPDKVDVPSRHDVLWATCGSLAERLANYKAATAEAILVFAERLPREFNVFLVRDAMAVSGRKMASCKGMQAWISKNADVLL